MYPNHRTVVYMPEVMNQIIPKMIPEIASQTGIPADHIINVFGALGSGSPEKSALLCDEKSECDGIHPNDAGMKIIAQTIAEALSK